ncbi:hypothetical protein [Muriicola sp. Z0-33]|uniref:hypothetical protein n=1 Tax=Muriicola sp. Z0-33 TaxID=2816957 RepID=UPI002238EE18|nr:hypothetical protein [Muriicola sp. Z0-33]MCW5516754.1 hypothetical protein [Muriicola sp. Z0-33]
MISCEQAAIICNKSQYHEASFLEKIKFRIHLFVCKACAGFTKKNTQLTALCEKAQLQQLSEEDKRLMKKELENKF